MNRAAELVRKLIAHEKSARAIGSYGEAEAFAQRVQELLLKHKLEMTDIEREAEERDDPIGDVVINPDDMSLTATLLTRGWAKTLVYQIAKAHFCEMILRQWKTGRYGRQQSNSIKGSFYLIGRASDRDVTLSMSKFLIGVAQSAAETATIRYANSSTFMRPALASDTNRLRKYKHSWLLGFTNAIYQRFESTKEHFTESNGEQGLVLVRKHEEALAEFKKTKFNKARKTRATKTTINTDAYSAGQEYGKNVNLSERKSLSA